MRTHAVLSGIIVLMISFVIGDKLGPLVYRTCKHNQDCAFFQGVCNTTNSQCDCAKGYVASSNHHQCVEVVQSMNATCTDENQCKGFLANTICAKNGTCVCKSGYRYEDNVCVKLPEYGQSCVKDEECPRIEGVVCVNNTVCECRSETVLGANNEKCLPVVTNILNNCTESVQCTARFRNSNCTNNTCRCDPGYHYANDPDQCVVTKAIDEDCTNEYECYQTEDDTNDSPNKSLTCADNKCTCAVNYHRQENRCVNNESYAECKYDDDCIANAYCRNQTTCSCKDNYIEYRINNSSKNTTMCLRVATYLGDPCKEDIQCKFTFTVQSECRAGACRCAHDSHFSDGRCYKSSGLGDPCLLNRNCIVINSFCEHSVCKCGLRLHANSNNTSCISSAKLGEICESDDECVVENSKCIKNRCDCNVKSVISNDGRRCLKSASLIGEECEQHSQCQLFLKHSQCGSNKMCECAAGSHKRGYRCYADVELGGLCDTHHHCVTRSFRDFNLTLKSKVDCVNGFCTCTEGYTLTEELQDCIQFSDNGATRWQAHGIFLIILITRFLV
ncbi:prion-like-(Q/N-rich) domain-bearing protein 25 isoform X2 [Pseudomyrmex gracilis]|uniref:prion-like-(Q/N-rich) domain-bearing protein 25 isoform X2 n=1 Tax=Pseudomyrmex gracilis TaxID=219809 RepID=UPI000995A2C3|nr:prion-like-(Q/N-rich) domain-bearing protein 25 isoform X2 [Pseudomyrmex gracilis]